MHRCSGRHILSLRVGSEVIKAEPPGQLFPDIVPFPAPIAVRIAAGGVPQSTDQPSRSGKLVAHPGRHHRIAPGHRQPRQRVGQFPALPVRIVRGRSPVGPAGNAVQALAYRDVRLRVGWPRRAPEDREEPVKPRVAVRRGQPVPGRQQIRRCRAEGLLLIVEHLQRQSRVQLRVVDAPAPQ